MTFLQLAAVAVGVSVGLVLGGAVVCVVAAAAAGDPEEWR